MGLSDGISSLLLLLVFFCFVPNPTIKTSMLIFSLSVCLGVFFTQSLLAFCGLFTNYYMVSICGSSQSVYAAEEPDQNVKL